MSTKQTQQKYKRLNGYQPKTNIVKDSDELHADSHNILSRWKNYFCHLLNIHTINDAMQTEMHTAEPLVP
jgi:hypothetical protein